MVREPIRLACKDCFVWNSQGNGLGHGGARRFVKALFLDYDGTISPLNMPASKSAVSPENLLILQEISRRIPVAVITTKDLSFVVKRTLFARAWSGAGGLETKIGNVVTKSPCLTERKPYLKTALDYARSLLGDDLTVEEKRDSEGTTIAFSIDWREAEDRSRAVEKALDVMSYCETLPVVTVKYEGQPFFDVFPCPIDKGKALLELKQRLELHDGILYLGDSMVDNPAFDVADISVGVIHEETPDSLTCEYFVKFGDVAAFLQHLLDDDMQFSPRMPPVLHRTEALQLIRRQIQGEAIR